VLSPAGELVQVVAGHYDLAHRAGCKIVDQMYRIPIEQPYDMVLASAGGFPFDIDLRQAHKGMENASRALAPGGVMVYWAECREGAGHRKFEEWVEAFADSAAMEQELKQHFVVGGHKAYWVARLGEQAKIFLVSSLADSFVRQCHLHPAPDPAATIEGELAKLRPGARIACIPHAGFTLPAAAAAPLMTSEKVWGV
jgi:nickel-dependent lactate racemase